MYITKTGEEIFVIDGHTHFWDGSPANQKNIHGKQFIDCFYAYHSGLSPKDQVWPKEKFEKYDAQTMYDDLFVRGYDDMAILQPTYLGDFYKNGFNTTERNYAMKKSHPDRFILNGAFDPRDGQKGIEHLHECAEKYQIKGIKLYTAEWKGDSKGYKLSDKESYRFLEEAQKLGVKKVELDELFRNADVITLHTPLIDKTRNIVDAAAIGKMKQGVRIINCARGGLVDEAAL